MAYGKLFEALYKGSMHGAGPARFAVWTWCIAYSKPPGLIEANPKVIASELGMQRSEVDEVLEWLQQPDEDSQTKEEGGRRLIATDSQFTYRMPSWPKWNAIKNEVERREANAKAAREYRARKKREGAAVTNDAMTRDDASSERHASAHGDVDADAGSINPSMVDALSEQKGAGSPASESRAAPDRGQNAEAIRAMMARVRAARADIPKP